MSGLHVVIGAGALGSGIAATLAARGERVRVVRRAATSPVQGVEVVAGDIRDASFAAHALSGASTVYQCAQPRYHRWAQEFAALQQGIMDAAASAGARVVIADNLYGFGDPAGAVITDDSPREPHTVKGRVRKAMADDALTDGRVEVTIARPSDYISPDYPVFASTVVRPALKGSAMQFIGRMDVPHSFSYVPDSVAAMVALASSEKSWGRAWITPALEPVTQQRLAELVWAAAGRSGEPRTSVMSKRAAGLIGLVVPDLREVVELWYEFERPFVASAEQFESEFGLVATPVELAVEQTVRALA